MPRAIISSAFFIILLTLTIGAATPNPTWTPVVVKPTHVTVVVQNDHGDPIEGCKATISPKVEFDLGPDGKGTGCTTLGTSNCRVWITGTGFSSYTDILGPVADYSTVVFIIQKCPENVTPVPGSEPQENDTPSK